MPIKYAVTGLIAFLPGSLPNSLTPSEHALPKPFGHPWQVAHGGKRRVICLASLQKRPKVQLTLRATSAYGTFFRGLLPGTEGHRCHCWGSLTIRHTLTFRSSTAFPRATPAQKPKPPKMSYGSLCHTCAQPPPGRGMEHWTLVPHHFHCKILGLPPRLAFVLG